MQQLKAILLPILLGNPFLSQRLNISNTFNESGQSDFFTVLKDDQVFYSDNNHIMPVILVKTKNDQNSELFSDQKSYPDEYEETEIQLTSNLKDNLFPKPGTTYTEKTETKRGSSSKQKSTLIFRQERKSKRGEVSSPRGHSDATHPENVANFERAGIPINPMKNPNKKPDKIQDWVWSKSKKQWTHGERKVRVGNKIITEKQWQKMLLNNSGKI